MAITADKIVVQLEADIDGYAAKISQAERVSDQKFDAIERKGFAMGQSLKKSFSLAQTAMVAFAGSIVIDKLVQATKFGLDYASSLGEMAQQLGISTNALQEYRYAATQVGLSSEEMDQALSQLTRRIGEGASGTKAQAEAFDKLGITVKDVEGKVLNAGDAIPLIADALQKIQSPAERAAILMDLFGRAGQKLEPLLSGGSAAVNQLRDAAHALGVVLSERQIQQADETADKLAALKTVMSANIAGAVANNSNAILGLANALATLVGWIGTTVTAYQKLKLLQGEVASKWQQYTSLDPNMRDQGAQQAERFRVNRARLDPNNIDRKGGFRDYGAAPVSGYKPRGAAGALGVAAPRPEKLTKPPKVGGAKAGGGGGSSGPSPAEVEREHAKRMDRLRVDELRAQLALTDDTEERARLLGDLLDAEYKSRLDEMQNDERFKKLKADKQADEIKALQRLYGVPTKPGEDELTVTGNSGLLARQINREAAERRERDAQQLADAQHEAQSDALQIQYDLAQSEGERKRIALEMLEAEREYLKSKLDAVILSDTANQAEKDRARVARTALDASGPGQRQLVANQHQGPLDQYLSNTDPAKNGERAEQLVVDELDHVQQGITSALTKALGTDDPLITGLIDMLLQEVLFRPLAEALKGGMDGAGGGLAGLVSSVGSIFGFAGGGSMQIGGRGGNDNNTLSLNGRPIANVERGETLSVGRKALSGRGGGSTIISSPQFDLRGAVVTQQLYADMERISQHNATQAAATMGQAVIKNVPKRMAQYDRDGT